MRKAIVVRTSSLRLFMLLTFKNFRRMARPIPRSRATPVTSTVLAGILDFSLNALAVLKFDMYTFISCQAASCVSGQVKLPDLALI